MQWFEAADLIVKGMEGAIAAKTVTYDFERLMEGAKLLKCSEFGDAITRTCNPVGGLSKSGSRWAPVFFDFQSMIPPGAHRIV